jgi:hypothetical protein
MDGVLGLYREALLEENGHKLAEAITPVAPPNDAGRLYAFYRSTNAYAVDTDLRNEIVYKSPLRLDKAESNAWVEVFGAYWRAIGELLAAEEAMNQGKKADWKKAYSAWKTVVNALIRGYTLSLFEAWTIPCLYTSGKYLRNLALKADEQARNADGNVTYSQGLQDDVVSNIGKNENLEDAAREINRIFGLCISDRYEHIIEFSFSCSSTEHIRAQLSESRKWGVYYVTNLLFKLHFKVDSYTTKIAWSKKLTVGDQLNSISLCKNLLRSIQVASHDMPPLDAFPKAHQVTFNYYSGVIFFLDEDYVKVNNRVHTMN